MHDMRPRHACARVCAYGKRARAFAAPGTVHVLHVLRQFWQPVALQLRAIKPSPASLYTLVHAVLMEPSTMLPAMPGYELSPMYLRSACA